MAQRPLGGDRPRLDTAQGSRRITQRELHELAAALNGKDRRHLLGIAGPPGAGKSWLAEQLAAALRPSPPVVPMDGFHLAQAVIDT